ncbi:Cyclin-dependent kinase 2 [Rhynchospora pubera]|uniref:Cyclin-dependent kinase 2 n=1 Tax=Rhynchospora pubera TaxID=906938 RepID=A0AAV8GGX2_9POAL|nr:Cyclin-dependent kinase 2 [Rhynchospora pubera]
MAASRHGGYTRDRGFYLDETRRMPYPLRSRYQDSYHCRRDLRREPNGIHNDYRNYPHRNHSPVTEKGALGREPGELSSDSRLDEPEPRRDDMGKENGVPVKTEENLTKKRKFSPIVWDRNEVRQPDVGSNRIDETGEELSVGGIPDRLLSQTEPVSIERPDILVVSPGHSGMDNGEIELGQIDEDEDSNLVVRTITSSRWAEDDDMDIIAPKKKRSISPMQRDPDKNVPTPESGGVLTDGSDRASSRPSSSGRGERGNDCAVVDGEQRAEHSDHSSQRGKDSEFRRDETPESAGPPQRRINMLQGCRSVDEFERLNKINEGTYGVVYRARDKKTGEIVALKKVKMEKEKEGFPMTSLREINILLSLNHPSIVDVKEVVVGSRLDSIFMVMEYMEHDLKGVMETMKQPYSQSEAKCLMLQLLEGVNYLHHNWVLHRDLKTSNLLLDNSGNLKLCDFGLARQYGSPLKPYTPLVVTLWYRAPELLLGAKEYSTAIDLWSVGCIMAELLTKEPLFDGGDEKTQLNKIFKTLGTPDEKSWPGYKNLPGAKAAFANQPYKLREKFSRASFSGQPTLSDAGLDLLYKLLTYDPEERITAEEALKHPWFSELPLPKSKDFMPTFPAHNNKDRTVRQRVMKNPDPVEEHLKAAKGREPWRIRLA